MFAPVDTFRFKIFENTVLSVWIFAVTMFALVMFASVDIVPN